MILSCGTMSSTNLVPAFPEPLEVQCRWSRGRKMEELGEEAQDAAAAETTHVEALDHAPAECTSALAQAEAALGEGRHADALAGFHNALELLRGAASESGQLPTSLQPLQLQLLDGVVCCLQSSGQAAAYGRVLDEAMACLALADVLAEKGAPHLRDAAKVLAMSGNLGEAVLDGVGGTRLPYLQSLLSNVEGSEFQLEDAPAAVASYLATPGAQEWKRVTGGQCFGAALHLLEAIQWFERMADFHARCGGRVRAQAIGSLGTVYAKLGQDGLAASFFQVLVQYGTDEEDHFAMSRAASALGVALDAMAMKDIRTNWLNFSQLQLRAIEAHKQASEAFAALGDKAEVTKCYFRIANGHALLREHHEAIAKLRFAQTAAEQVKDIRVVADAVREIGLQYQLLAQHRSAVEKHEADYQLQETLQNRLGCGRASRNLAVSKRALGVYKQALKLAVSSELMIA